MSSRRNLILKNLPYSMVHDIQSSSGSTPVASGNPSTEAQPIQSVDSDVTLGPTCNSNCTEPSVSFATESLEEPEERARLTLKSRHNTREEEFHSNSSDYPNALAPVQPEPAQRDTTPASSDEGDESEATESSNYSDSDNQSEASYTSMSGLNVQELLDEFAKELDPVFRNGPTYQTLEKFFLETDAEYTRLHLIDEPRPDKGYIIVSKDIILALNRCRLDPQYSTYPFLELVEECIAFFATSLGPFCREHAEALPAKNVFLKEQYFWSAVRVFCPHPYDYGSEDMEERWRRRLLRDGQAKLIIEVMKGCLANVRALLALDDVIRPTERNEAIEIVLYDTYLGLAVFFCSPNLRSERIENTILGYLVEDEINWDVVNGVHFAGKKHNEDVLALEEDENLSYEQKEAIRSSMLERRTMTGHEFEDRFE
ncbi:hypothetical protein BJ508DRAFT_381187 [Ascobolus immersus RN42]|uniref:Uncharacterized protein n=1 Tax=Ascobolus immersus RN42 TaxID=1160509 RepID=A0A3N4HMV8_ASCIM|nr:hypothetical protein BJ508DRAFT_381187 [Ascobolus immersus RN42]